MNFLYIQKKISGSSKINEDLSIYPLITCVRPRRPKYSGSLLSLAMCEILLCGVMCPVPKPLQVQSTSSLSRGGPEWSTSRRFHCSLICNQMPDNVRKYLAFTLLLVVSPSARLMYGEYWFCLSRLSMMVIGSFASYTKTKSVESAV